MVANAFAEEKAPIGNLGKGNLAIKVGYINFTDDFFSEYDDEGVYLGLEAYVGITDNFYLGGEVGVADNVTLFGGEDVDYVPVELNAKYAVSLSPHLIFDIGGGVSYNYVKITYEPFLGEAVEIGEDWLIGGQVFSDLTFRINWFSIGLYGKYQITDDFEDTDTDLSNFRWGLNIGIVF